MATATLVIDIDPDTGKVRYASLWPDEVRPWKLDILEKRGVQKLLAGRARFLSSAESFYLLCNIPHEGCDIAKPVSLGLDFTAETQEGLRVINAIGEEMKFPYEKVFSFPH